MDKTLEILFDEHFQNDFNTSHRISSQNLFKVRVAIFIYLTIAIFDFQLMQQNFSHQFAYLTIWGASLTYLYFYLVIIENFSFMKNRNQQYFHDRLWQFTHLIFTLAFSLELPIFVIYWGYIYPQWPLTTARDWILNINLHIMFFLSITLDAYLNDVKLLKKHVHVLLTVGIFYMFINMIVVLTTGNELYPGITWKNWISYLTVVISTFLMLSTFYGGRYYYNTVKVNYLQKNKQLLTTTI